MKTLSICIPSYNRFEKLVKTIKSILKAKSRDFEIVVIDNCTPRDINQFFDMEDERLRIIKREIPVYGGKNVGDAILYGRSKYSLLLLDKDEIIGKQLDRFIEILKNSDVCGGYCVLNSKAERVDVIKKHSVCSFGYLSKHPSGNFYKIDLLRNYIKENDKILERDPFSFDIYLAYCASKGSMMRYNYPLVCSSLNNSTEKDEGTLTFKKELGNLYYLPQNRMDQFKRYVDCLGKLDISKKEKLATLRKMYVNLFDYVTYEYRNIMSNEGTCRHYGHSTENISFAQMHSLKKRARKFYKEMQIKYLSDTQKKCVDIMVNIKYVLRISKRAIKRIIKR